MVAFRDSLKVLEVDIQHANTLFGACVVHHVVNSSLAVCHRPSECSRDYDRACLQMRMSYSPAMRIFLFLMKWTNCSLAGTVGLLRILLSICLCGRHHHNVHP